MILEVKQFGEIGFTNHPCVVSVFLAGGINNVEANWQAEVISYLKEFDSKFKYKDECILVVYNPRERHILWSDTIGLDNIIKWDCESLEKSDILSFYFASGSAAQASSQFELGRYMTSLDGINDLEYKLIVGIEDGYIGKDKLYAYLKYLIKDCIVESIVHLNQNPKEQAKYIYYSYIIALMNKTDGAIKFHDYDYNNFK